MLKCIRACFDQLVFESTMSCSQIDQRNKQAKTKNTFASILFILLPNDASGQHGPGGPGGDGGHDIKGPHAPPGVALFKDTCPADTSTTSACLVDRLGNETRGAWVCRTVFNIVTGEDNTFSACVGTNQFIETDRCGCCDGTCPSTTPCGFVCNMTQPFDPQ
jgi:hypothetical protein